MLLGVLPCALMVAFHYHVDTLNDIAIRIVLECNNAFQTKYVRAFGLRDLLDPRKKLPWVHFA